MVPFIVDSEEIVLHFTQITSLEAKSLQTFIKMPVSDKTFELFHNEYSYSFV